MAEISRFHGIRILLYLESGGKHHEPRIHVVYGGDEASIDLYGNILQYRL